MNRLRFGALLIADSGLAGFYLSHRIVLSVPAAGSLRAISMESFKPCRVFTRNGAAVAFPDAMLDIANGDASFTNSVQMIGSALKNTGITSAEELVSFISEKFDATLEKFEVPALPPATDEHNNKRRKEMENYDPEKAFNDDLEVEQEKQAKNIHRPTILLCGYTGCGKSSLAKTILGDVVPEEAVGAGKPTTMDFSIYEGDFIRIWDSKGLESGETEEEFEAKAHKFVRERQNDPDVDKHIHLVWYTIHGGLGKVTDCDLKLIKNVFNPQNVIVVITQADITSEKKKTALIEHLTANGISPERIICTSDAEYGSRGCKELVDLSLQMLPDAYKDAFISAQQVDKEMKIQAVYDKAEEAKKIVLQTVAAAFGEGFNPLPIADAALLIPTQVAMIVRLAVLYGLDKDAVKLSALPFVAKLVGVFTASTLLKLIPILGSLVNAGVASALTYALGMYVKGNFEETAIAKIEGRPAPELAFDLDAFKAFYEEYKAQH